MKHKQLFRRLVMIATLMSISIGGVITPVSATNDDTTILIICKDHYQITVPKTYTDAQKDKACKDAGHTGFEPGTPPATPPNPPTGVDCTDMGNCAKTAFTFGNCSTSSTGITCLVNEVVLFLSIGVGIAVVGSIAAGGLLYATSEGNPSKTQRGITLIVNAIIGLVLYLLMYAIIRFLVPGEVFG